MPLKANEANKQLSGGSKQPLLEPGNYLARVVQVVDLGLQPQAAYQGKPKEPVEMISVTYELPTEFCVDEDGNPDESKPRWVSEKFGLYPMSSDRAKSTIRMKGIDPSDDFDGDWSCVLDQPCTVTVVHNVKQQNGETRTYVNVGNVTPPMKGIEVPPLKNDTLMFDLGDPNKESFERLPSWVQDQIKGNLRYQGSDLQKLLEGAQAASQAPSTPEPEAPEVDVDEEEESPY